MVRYFGGGGLRTEGQVSRVKVQGPRTKDQGQRTVERGAVACGPRACGLWTEGLWPVWPVAWPHRVEG